MVEIYFEGSVGPELQQLRSVHGYNRKNADARRLPLFHRAF